MGLTPENQPQTNHGDNVVTTLLAQCGQLKKTHDLQLSKKTFSNKKKGPRSTGSLLLIFFKKKNNPDRLSKKIFFKKM